MLLNDGHCASIAVPSDIVADIQLRTFTDSSNGIHYCIALDHKDQNGDHIWDNGFMLFITPDSRYDIQRRVHFQGAHPVYDVGTLVQNANIFQQIGAQSFLASGIHPYAFDKNPPGWQSTCHAGQYATDANEDDKLAFHFAFRQIYNTSNAQSWNPWYVQLHGAGGACTPDIFISYGNTNPAYYSPAGNIAVNLRNYMNTPNTAYKADTPYSNSCSLTGVRNLQGRIVNGVPIGSECPTLASSATSQFLSIEQKPAVVGTTAWYGAFRTYVPTDCAPGRSYVSITMMCS
jgi:hypothetical protein